MIKIFDPIKIIEDIFNRLYPEKECRIDFVTELHKKTGAWGETCWPKDGGLPIVQIEVEIVFQGFVEILAHELAHVVAGYEAGHGEKWKSVFDKLHKEYNHTVNSLMPECHICGEEPYGICEGCGKLSCEDHYKQALCDTCMDKINEMSRSEQL